MKRIIILIVVAFLCASPVMADWFDGGSTANIEFSTYTCDNDTGIYQKTFVSKTTVVPATARILGFYVGPLLDTATVNSELVATLHDAEITDPFVDESIIDEAESANNSGKSTWFPYPRKIRIQLMINQGPNTRVIVYYDK